LNYLPGRVGGECHWCLFQFLFLSSESLAKKRVYHVFTRGFNNYPD
jgi:hypothetical protein